MKKRMKGKAFGIVTFVLFFIVLAICLGLKYFKLEPLQEKEQMEKPKVKIVLEDSTSRPYAVMINNIAVARPYHSGLQDAYFVYEMIVEGGITRFLALFQDTAIERIGPIRSARPYYLDYAMEHDAYFVHWGFSEQAKKDITYYGIQNINGLYQSNYFWKDHSLSVATEHRAFTSMEKLKNGAMKLGYREKRKGDYIMSYSAIPLDFSSNGTIKTANEVVIPYSNNTKTMYRYDENKKVYVRFVNDVAHTDYVTKEQYFAKNILVYQVSNRSIDSYGRQALDLIGRGEGYYITDGIAVPIIWEKSSRNQKTKYYYADGSEVVLNDGNTWIQIAPFNQKISIS